jgi:DNA-binding CsgD family transcriptional regulator
MTGHLLQEVALAGCNRQALTTMESISVRSVQVLLRSLEMIHGAEDLKQFPDVVFSALGRVVEGSIFSLDTFNVKTGEVISATSDNVAISSEIKKRIVELVPTNPVIPFARSGAAGAIRLTDCISQRQFEQTALYSDVFVPLGIRHQTVVTLDITGLIGGITVNRDKDFAEEEALLLSLAAPHLALAHRNLKRIETLRATADEVVPGPQDLERIGLTPREAEVLHWVIKGKQDGVIATILRISVRTVHQHIARILRKLQSETRGSAGYEAMVKLKGLQSCTLGGIAAPVAD